MKDCYKALNNPATINNISYPAFTVHYTIVENPSFFNLTMSLSNYLLLSRYKFILQVVVEILENLFEDEEEKLFFPFQNFTNSLVFWLESWWAYAVCNFFYCSNFDFSSFSRLLTYIIFLGLWCNSEETKIYHYFCLKMCWYSLSFLFIFIKNFFVGFLRDKKPWQEK